MNDIKEACYLKILAIFTFGTITMAFMASLALEVKIASITQKTPIVQYSTPYGEHETFQNKLSYELRQQLKLRTDNGIIRIVVRLEEANVENLKENEVLEALKAHADRTQKPILEFLRNENAVILNAFWLTNAIVAYVRENTIYELISFPAVRRIHEDFQIPLIKPVKSPISNGERG
jgi:hypothetical protein